jgi:hypothetical protein
MSLAAYFGTVSEKQYKLLSHCNAGRYTYWKNLCNRADPCTIRCTHFYLRHLHRLFLKTIQKSTYLEPEEVMPTVLGTAEKCGDKKGLKGFKLRLYCEICRNTKNVDTDKVKATIQHLAESLEGDADMPEPMKRAMTVLHNVVKDANEDKVVKLIFEQQKKVGYDVPNPFLNNVIKNSEFNGTDAYETTMASLRSLQIVAKEGAIEKEVYGSVILLTTLFVLLLTNKKD